MTQPTNGYRSHVSSRVSSHVSTSTSSTASSTASISEIRAGERARVSQTTQVFSNGETTQSSRVTLSGGQTAQHQTAQQMQIRLSRTHLHQPHRLTVYTTGTRLSGQIKIDGRTVRTLGNGATVLDLVPYLSPGPHTVEVTGSYAPSSAAVGISLVAPGTQFNQQSSGQGQVNQRLEIFVQ